MKAPMQTAATVSQNAPGRFLIRSGRLGSTSSRCHPVERWVSSATILHASTVAEENQKSNSNYCFDTIS